MSLTLSKIEFRDGSILRHKPIDLCSSGMWFKISALQASQGTLSTSWRVSCAAKEVWQGKMEPLATISRISSRIASPLWLAMAATHPLRLAFSSKLSRVPLRTLHLSGSSATTHPLRVWYPRREENEIGQEQARVQGQQGTRARRSQVHRIIPNQVVYESGLTHPIPVSLIRLSIVEPPKIGHYRHMDKAHLVAVGCWELPYPSVTHWAKSSDWAA